MIDGSKGFHEIPKVDLSLTRISASAEQTIKHLDAIIEKTRGGAPVRKARRVGSTYKLSRDPKGGEPDERSREACIERAIFRKWGPVTRISCKDSAFLPSVCQFIQTYQMPLQDKRADAAWGKIDLVGVSFEWLPVVIELKEEKSVETPLRMLVEATGYAVAVSKAWKDGCLREEWCKSIERVMAASAPKFEWPDKLQTVPIICAAPRAYWKQRRGKAGAEPNALPKEAWKALADLMSALNDEGFPVTLVEFDAKKGVGDEPMIDQVASFAPPV